MVTVERIDDRYISEDHGILKVFAQQVAALGSHRRRKLASLTRLTSFVSAVAPRDHCGRSRLQTGVSRLCAGRSRSRSCLPPPCHRSFVCALSGESMKRRKPRFLPSAKNMTLRLSRQGAATWQSAVRPVLAPAPSV